MAKIHAYLNFEGNCESAFTFYKTAFRTEFDQISKYSDLPKKEGEISNNNHNDYILHVSMTISEGCILMGSDIIDQPHQQLIKGTNISLSINAESVEEADRLFNELSIRGNVIMPLERTFWNAYFGMFCDQFGINWMINYDFES